MKKPILVFIAVILAVTISGGVAYGNAGPHPVRNQVNIFDPRLNETPWDIPTNCYPNISRGVSGTSISSGSGLSATNGNLFFGLLTKIFGLNYFTISIHWKVTSSENEDSHRAVLLLRR